MWKNEFFWFFLEFVIIRVFFVLFRVFGFRIIFIIFGVFYIYFGFSFILLKNDIGMYIIFFFDSLYRKFLLLVIKGVSIK